jgi:predicted transposase YbfD/YdcC
MEQETTFYEELQIHPGLDLRDNRGKRLDMALVLLGVILALLRYRDGTLSSIHRSMANNQVKLCSALGIDNEQVVSRSHLPRVLTKVSRVAFEQLLFKYAQIELDEEQKQWFAGDGKELRGSIEKGNKGGEVSVQIVSHKDRAVIGQAFYNGTKESEKPCLQQLVQQTGVQSQQITADALHLCPAMTEPIEQAGGIFAIGLKDNQKDLLQDMIDHAEAFTPKAQHKTVDKGHGRLEIRQYSCFDVSGEYFESRWDKTFFRSLIEVRRTRIVLKTNKSSEEVSYYLSNGESENAEEYFLAVRNHWAIEVNNHYREVSLKEDQLRTKKSLLPKYWRLSDRWSWNYFDDGSLITSLHKCTDFKIISKN